MRSSGEVKTREIVNPLKKHLGERTVKLALKNLERRGLAHSPRRGYWKAGPWEVTVDSGEPVQESAKVQ
jgi:restriction endonuclease Mrr